MFIYTALIILRFFFLIATFKCVSIFFVRDFLGEQASNFITEVNKISFHVERTAFIGNLCFPKRGPSVFSGWQFRAGSCSSGLLFWYYLNINYLRLVYLDGGVRGQKETVKQIISNGWNRSSQAKFHRAAKSITAPFPLTSVWVIKLNPLEILWNFSLQYLWKCFTVKLYFQFHSQ